VDSSRIKLRRADDTDLPFIMATERIAGFEELVGRWDAAQHRAALADRRYAYFIARDGSEPVGFAILRDWASPEQVTLLKRIAIARPGIGIGRVFLAQLVDLAFGDTEVYRLWLGVFPDNARAQKAYETAGFRAEGIARGSAYFGGLHRDELVMAMLRPDWIRSAPSDVSQAG
jgi:diamine N-acetyltransferase